jgi:hypothetical protein
MEPTDIRDAGPDPGHDQALRRPGQAKREPGPRVSTRVPPIAQNKAQDPAINVNKALPRRFCVNPRLEKQAFSCHGQYCVDAPIMRLHSIG